MTSAVQRVREPFVPKLKYLCVKYPYVLKL